VQVGDLVKCLAPQTPGAFGIIVKRIDHIKLPDGVCFWSVWVHEWSEKKGEPLPYEASQLELVSESR